MPEPSALRQFFERQGRDLKRGAQFGARGLLNDVRLLMGSPAAEGFETLIPNAALGIGALFGNERARELFEATIQSSADIVGFHEEPQGFMENLQEFGPGAFIPLPKGLTAGLQTMRPTARIAAELALPFNQIRTVPAVTAAATLPAALVTGGEALIDAATVDQEEQEETPRLAQDMPAPPIADSPSLPPPPIAGAPSTPFDVRGVVPLDDEIDELSPLASSAIAVGTALSIMGARRKIRGFRGDPTELTGAREPRQQITGIGPKVVESIADQHAPLLAAAKKAKPAGFDQFKALLKTTMTPGAMSNRIRGALKMGDLPNTHITIPSPVIHMETLAKMTPIQRASYNDTLTAMNKIDDLNIAGTSMWGDVGRDTLEARARKGMTDPLVARMVNEAHEMYRGLRDYIHDAGVWSDAQYQEIVRTRPNFVPTQIDFGAQRIPFVSFFETADDMFVKQHADFLKSRKGLIEPRTGLPPQQLIEPYVQQVVRAVESNRVRRQFLETLEGTELAGESVKKVATPNKLTATVTVGGRPVHYQIGDDAIRRALEFNPRLVVPVMNGTRRIFQEFTTGLLNPMFAPVSWSYEAGSAVLLKKPGQAVGLLDQALKRSIGKTLPLDPSIVASPAIGTARSAYEDMMFAMGRNMEVSLRTNGRIAQLIGPEATQSLARVGIRAYENGFNRIAEQFGAGNAVFSPSREVESAASMLDQVAPKFFAATNEAGFAPNRLRTLWGNYIHFMSQMHNGIRLQSLAANVTPDERELNNIFRDRAATKAFREADPEGFARAVSQQAEARKSLTQKTADTRTLGSDTSQIAGGTKAGRVTQGFVSSVPYANIAIQVVAEHARAMRANPAKYMATFSGIVTGGMALMYSQFRGNPQAQDHYFNSLTAEQRAANIPIYAPNSNHILFNVPIEHVYRPVWSPTMEMLGAATGMKRGITPEQVEETMMRGELLELMSTDFSEEETMELRTGLTTALRQVAPDIVPPVVGLGLAAGGKQVSLGRFAQGDEFFGDIRTENITSEREDRVAGDVFSAEVEGMFNELLGTGALPLLQSINAFNREFTETEDFGRSMEAAASRFGGASLDRTAPVTGLFGLAQRITTNDANAKLYRNKVDALRDISLRFGIDLSNPEGSGAGVSRQLPSGITPEDIRNTALGFVLDTAARTAGSGMRDVNAELQFAFKTLQDIRRDPDFANNAKTLRKFENDITARIKGTYAGGVERLQVQEDEINQQLQSLGFEGVFRFDKFDADMAEILAQIPLPPFKGQTPP